MLRGHPGNKYYAVGMKSKGGSWVWRSDEAPLTWTNWMARYPKSGKAYVWYDSRQAKWNNQGPTTYNNDRGELVSVCQRDCKYYVIVLFLLFTSTSARIAGNMTNY